MAETDEAMLLDVPTRRLHQALIDAVLASGSAPELPALAEQLATSQAAIQERLRSLVAADYLALDANGHVTCLYPLSVSPTPHVVVVDGVRRFAMCSIDALGMPAMLHQELDIEGSCAVCKTAIALHVRAGTVLTASPPDAMVVARRDEAEPAFATCCPFTVFVCGQAHADQFMHQVTGARTLSLADALQHAEAVFGGLLAESIPATRPRGKGWGPDRDT